MLVNLASLVERLRWDGRIPGYARPRGIGVTVVLDKGLQSLVFRPVQLDEPGPVHREHRAIGLHLVPATAVGDITVGCRIPLRPPGLDVGDVLPYAIPRLRKDDGVLLL